MTWLTKNWEYTWEDAIHDARVEKNWQDNPEYMNDNWKLLLKNRGL